MPYFDVDKYSYINRLSKCSPITKLFLCLSGILLSVSSPSPPVPIIIFCVLTVLLIFLARVPAKLYCKMLAYPIFLTLLNCIVIALFFGSKNPIEYIGILRYPIPIQGYGITVYGDAVDLAITLFCRVLGGVSSLFFLSLTTPMMDTWIVLRKMGIPSILVEMSMLMYRYLFVFLEYASRMRLAQELRLGYSTLRRSFRSISLVAANLFVGTLQQGERTFTAMTARGYDGNIRMLTDIPKPALSSIAGIVAFDILMVFIIFLTQHVTVV